MFGRGEQSGQQLSRKFLEDLGMFELGEDLPPVQAKCRGHWYSPDGAYLGNVSPSSKQLAALIDQLPAHILVIPDEVMQKLAGNFRWDSSALDTVNRAVVDTTATTLDPASVLDNTVAIIAPQVRGNKAGVYQLGEVYEQTGPAEEVVTLTLGLFGRKIAVRRRRPNEIHQILSHLTGKEPRDFPLYDEYTKRSDFIKRIEALKERIDAKHNQGNDQGTRQRLVLGAHSSPLSRSYEIRLWLKEKNKLAEIAGIDFQNLFDNQDPHAMVTMHGVLINQESDSNALDQLWAAEKKVGDSGNVSQVSFGGEGWKTYKRRMSPEEVSAVVDRLEKGEIVNYDWFIRNDERNRCFNLRGHGWGRGAKTANLPGNIDQPPPNPN